MPISVDEEYDGLIKLKTQTLPPKIFVATQLAYNYDELGHQALEEPECQRLAQPITPWLNRLPVAEQFYDSPGIRIPAPLLRMSIRPKPVDISFWHNFSVGIIPYGLGLTADFGFTVGIPVTADFGFTVGIPVATIADPTNVLAAHIGQGAVLVQWSHPTPELVRYYEVYGSVIDGGPYTKLQTGEANGNNVVLHNLPLANTVYLQVRAVGRNLATSNFVACKQGKFQYPEVRCQFRAISGSVISAGAIFTAADQETGRVIGLKATAQINITC